MSIRHAWEKAGTPETNRTSDLPLRRGLLYPLSYRGVSDLFSAFALHFTRLGCKRCRPADATVTLVNDIFKQLL